MELARIKEEQKAIGSKRNNMQLAAKALQEMYSERRSATTLEAAYYDYDKYTGLDRLDEGWLDPEEQLVAPPTPK